MQITRNVRKCSLRYFPFYCPLKLQIAIVLNRIHTHQKRRTTKIRMILVVRLNYFLECLCNDVELLNLLEVSVLDVVVAV